VFKTESNTSNDWIWFKTQIVVAPYEFIPVGLAENLPNHKTSILVKFPVQVTVTQGSIVPLFSSLIGTYNLYKFQSIFFFSSGSHIEDLSYMIQPQFQTWSTRAILVNLFYLIIYLGIRYRSFHPEKHVTTRPQTTSSSY
jgi:hypothetical protein